ncbi:MAG: hypothetical protein ACE5FB_03775 [Candidatus Binatia bacterium]
MKLRTNWATKVIAFSLGLISFAVMVSPGYAQDQDKKRKVLEQPKKRYSQEKDAAPKVYEAVAETSRREETQTEFVCKVTDLGKLLCTPVDYLLPFYNAEMRRAILDDINSIYDVYNLDPGKNALVACGDGIWTAVDSQDESNSGSAVSDQSGDSATANSQGAVDESSGTAENFMDSTAERALDSCAKLRKLFGDHTPALTATDFSGISGIDSYAGISICGAPSSTIGSGVDDFTEKAMKYAEEMAKQCEPTLAPMEGEDPPLEPIPDTQVQPSEDATIVDSQTTKEDNGDGTTTTTTTTTWSDGTQTTVSTTRDNSTGDPVRQDAQASRDGATSDSRQTFNSDGSSSKSSVDTGSDGTKHYKNSTRNRDGTVTPGQEVLIIPGGVVMIKGSDGKWRQARDCFDEACSSCKNFIDFYPELVHACHSAGSADVELCEDFARTAECCSNPNAIAADPRIVIPNPNGDFVCMGEIDQSYYKQESCDTRCSIASYHEDCNSICMASDPGFVGVSVLDIFCMYMESEACFSGPGIERPGRGGEGVRGGVLPIPTLMEDYMAQPLVEGDFERSSGPLLQRYSNPTRADQIEFHRLPTERGLARP